MNTTATDNTEIMEIMQTLMNEGTKGFTSVVAKMYNLAMQFERELHLGAGRYERTEGRSGYANGYKEAWYAQSALKASKETGDGGVSMILDHFRRVLK